ncbi:MAG: endonuclease NucS [Myxococcota bacterium]
MWRGKSRGCEALAAAAFDDEAALHALVEDAPQLLPLAGADGLAILGREVAVGSGYVDLRGVESSGRLVVIEIKVAHNAEARRKVVSQVLDYAASLRGTSLDSLERTLAPSLRAQGFTAIEDVVRAQSQSGAFDVATLREGLAASVTSGRFRLALVLDTVPLQLAGLPATSPPSPGASTSTSSRCASASSRASGCSFPAAWTSTGRVRPLVSGRARRRAS